MKKYFLSLLCVAGFGLNVQAASIMGFEISPEFGLGAGQTKQTLSSVDTNFKVIVCLGVFGSVLLILW